MASIKRLVSRLYPDRNGTEKVLGPLEAAIMEQLWQSGEATATEIWEGLSRRAPARRGPGPTELSYSTVRTVMNRLVSKGLLSRVLEGKAYLYRPLISRNELAQQIARGMLDGLLSGLAEPVLSSFLDRLSREDEDRLLELSKLIEERRAIGISLPDGLQSGSAGDGPAAGRRSRAYLRRAGGLPHR